MTIPKKGSRSISVDGHQLRWVVKGNDGTIDLTMQHQSGTGQVLQAYFHYSGVYRKEKPGHFRGIRQGRAVTPEAARIISKWALENGWDTERDDPEPFRIGTDQTELLVPVTVKLGEDEIVLD